MTPADTVAGRLDGGRIGKAVRRPCLAPERDERTNGRIERAAGRARNLDRAPQYGDHFGADANRCARALDHAQLAVRPVVAHQAVEIGNPPERVARGSFGGVPIGGVQHETHRKAHVDLGEFVGARRSELGVKGYREDNGNKGWRVEHQ